jgi:hypothetical protein
MIPVPSAQARAGLSLVQKADTFAGCPVRDYGADKS